jgi:hypothetical protein
MNPNTKDGIFVLCLLVMLVGMGLVAFRRSFVEYKHLERICHSLHCTGDATPVLDARDRCVCIMLAREGAHP